MGNKVKIQMPTEKVYSIIDQAHQLGYRGRVTLHGSSEPLLDPRFMEFARYIKKKGMGITENTNGDVLRENPDLCSQLDNVLDALHIGLYDYDNDHEKCEQMEFWKKRFKHTKVTFSLPKDRCRIRRSAKAPGENNLKAPRVDLPCYAPAHFVIRYDGEVCLCCEDDLCNFSFGNVFRQSLRELWWSSKHINMVRKLAKKGGRREVELCRNCRCDYYIDTFKHNESKK
jgi:radical SAM protein with 4Fe4S-binding SPASM domain